MGTDCNCDCNECPPVNCLEQAIRDALATLQEELEALVKRAEDAAKASEDAAAASAASASEAKGYRDAAELAATTATDALKTITSTAVVLEATAKKLQEIADELATAIAGIAVVTWYYTTVSEGQTVIPVPEERKALAVQAIYIEGIRQEQGRGFEYDKTSGEIKLAEPLPLGIEIAIILGTYSDNPSDFTHVLASNNGASLVGTSSGQTVQEELNDIDTDLVKLKFNWAIENGYADAGFTFATGGTLTTADRDKVVYDPVSKAWYSWAGGLPKVVPAATNPLLDANWKPQIDPKLRSDLLKIDGLSLIGELTSVAGFAGLATAPMKHVRLRGWNADSNAGSGDFYYSPTTPKSYHDGGMFISPTVPYTTAIDFIKGTGETDPSGNGCWVRDGIDTAKGIDLSWWDPSALAKHSDVIQKALNKAKLLKLDLYIPAGEFILDKTLTYDYASGVGANGVRGGNIIGAGSKRTILIQDVAGGNFPGNGVAFQITGSIDTPSFQIDKFTVRGFSIRGNGTVAGGTANTGTFFLMERMMGFVIEDIFSNNLYRSLIVQDSLYGSIRDCRISSSIEGVLFRKQNTQTGVNVVTLERVDFIDCWRFCLQMVESHQIVLDNCAFEANGNRDTSGVACIVARRVGGAGGVGVDIRNCYFENNNMRDITFAYDLNAYCQHSIRNCNFAKTGANVYSWRVDVTGSVTPTAAAYFKLTMTDNQFLVGGSYVDDPVNRPDVVFSGFNWSSGMADRVKFIDENNVMTAGYVITSAVSRVASRGDLFTARVGADGVLSAAGSANVVSVTKTGTGTYTIVSNAILNKAVFLTRLHNGNVGGITITATGPGSSTATVTTTNSSGVPTDLAFSVKAVML
nr:MAG: Pectate lyase superfamily protein [Bacteriophage sp.]